jgi:hypothetical protein
MQIGRYGCRPTTSHHARPWGAFFSKAAITRVRSHIWSSPRSRLRTARRSGSRSPLRTATPAGRLTPRGSERLTDKRGRPLTDLKKEDITLMDNGVKQQVLGFRLVDATADTAANRKRTPHLITLVFENMDADARRQAKVAGMELLKTIPPEGIYVGVVGINQQLSLLQPFTTDKEALKNAIEMATSGQPLAWIERSNSQKAALSASLASAQGEDRASSTSAGECGARRTWTSLSETLSAKPTGRT